MTELPVRLELVSTGGTITEATGVLQRFSSFDRVKRAVVVLLVGVAGAALLIPIPIVHLVGIPLLLLLGVVGAVRQLGLVGRLKPVRVACPHCGAMNRLGGGMGLVRIDIPMELQCDSCRRGLTLRFHPMEA